MDEVWSFGGVIALWLGLSCGLWWLHRRSVHGGQRRQMQQAERAAIYVGEAQPVFDAIRSTAALAPPSNDARLTAETLALLKRIQEHAAFFDDVNTLRVQMQASFGMEEHAPLSEVLHIRRDLWAASEILLVEDVSSFGASFAEEGAYERLRGEAAALLFKQASAASSEDDLIDLRLSLARADADVFIEALNEAIRAAREQDRLPTPSEVIAYPIAWIGALPRMLRTARAFLSAFFFHAGDAARAIRDSETMARGASQLRQAREELPQRLATGLERASATARESAAGLRRHYDFLAAAHDFQAKYEQVLRKAPEVTERGRQFILRLELAERSERLRLTSANFLIWLTRQLVNGLGHLIAALQRVHAELSATGPWALATATLAPTPVRGRQTSAFRSYRMALVSAGLREEQARPPTLAARPAATTKGKLAAKSGGVSSGQAKDAGRRAKQPAGATTSKKAVAAPAKAAKPKLATKTLAVPKDALPATVRGDASGQAAADKKANGKILASGPTAIPAKRPKDVAIKQNDAQASPQSKKDRRDKKRESMLGALFRRENLTPVAATDKTIAQPTPELVPEPPTRLAPEPKPAPPKPFKADVPQRTAKLSEFPAAIAQEAAPAQPALADQIGVSPEPAKRTEPPKRVETKIGSASALPSDIVSVAPDPVHPQEKRRSFLARLFGRANAASERPPSTLETLPIADPAQASAEASKDMPGETTPTLLAKLLDVDDGVGGENGDQETNIDDAFEDEDEDESEGEPQDEPGPLTLSVMELQAKMTPKPPQIRSFPWLRG